MKRDDMMRSGDVRLLTKAEARRGGSMLMNIGTCSPRVRHPDHAPIADTCRLTAVPPVCYARCMSVSERELLHHLSRLPFADTAELAMITGEAHVAIHRGLAGMLVDGIVERVSHGTSHLT